MKNLILPMALGLLTFGVAGPVSANDEALYGAPLPSDAVFIRWLGAAAQSAQTVLSYQFAADDIANEAYVAISNGALTGAQAGGYYSVVVDADGATQLIAEPQRENKAKVHLLLLNAAPTPVHMTLAGTTKEVIGETSFGAVNTRAVNPVSARLAVAPVDASDSAAEFDVVLRRGQNITVAVLAGEVRVIENRFGTVIAAE